MKTIKINPKKLIFDSKATLACKSCKHYGFKATCPPYVESLEYFKKVLTTYNYGISYIEEFEVNQEMWEETGKISSLSIYAALLKKREELFGTGHYFCTMLGAGSCKLCKSCTFPCKHPEKSIIPLEGTGVDVVATLQKYNIKIEFPIKDTFYRIGMILWD